jgi:hypothetical protein
MGDKKSSTGEKSHQSNTHIKKEMMVKKVKRQRRIKREQEKTQGRHGK